MSDMASPPLSECEKVWLLCDDLNGAIYAAVKAGYRVDMRMEQYREFGLRDMFTIVEANVYKGITLDDKVNV